MVHKVCEFYKQVYILATKVPKRDRFGIFSRIENTCLDLIISVITAVYETKTNKLPYLKTARNKAELLKRLLRIALELNIITLKKHAAFQTDLQEISKMTNGWIKYVEKP